MTEQHDTIKNLLDVVAIATTAGTFLDVISPIFGLIGAVVGVMRIVEMATGKPFSQVLRRKKADDASNK